MRAIVPVVAFVAVIGCATPARAQTRTRAFVEFAAGSSVATPAPVTQDTRFTQFLETADITSVMRLDRGARVGGRVGWWITPRIGIAAGVSALHATGTVQGVYAFPSPFVFNMPVTGTATASIARTCIDTDLDVLASLVDARGWQLTAGVGPDIARVRQPLLADVLSASYEFPFTSIALTPVSGRSRGGAVGLHVIASLARHLGRRLDLTGMLEYRRTRVNLTDGDGAVALDAGGVTAAGGLRLRF